MEQDLTLPEVLADPLIAQLREADSVAFGSFAQLMESAARVHTRRMLAQMQEEQAETLYRQVETAAWKNRLS